MEREREYGEGEGIRSKQANVLAYLFLQTKTRGKAGQNPSTDYGLRGRL